MPTTYHFQYVCCYLFSISFSVSRSTSSQHFYESSKCFILPTIQLASHSLVIPECYIQRMHVASRLTRAYLDVVFHVFIPPSPATTDPFSKQAGPEDGHCGVRSS